MAESATAVLTIPRDEVENAKPKPRRQPRYAVIVENDNDHTFPYVIEVLHKVFGYDGQKCLKLAEKIHLDGRAVVWTGTMELAELKRDQVKSGGTDHFGKKPVKYPLGCYIEPLPG